jgi:serine/threonine protein kinase
VADALEHCHAQGVCHGDVYAHNVLRDEGGNVTLCDFGASFSYDTTKQAFFQAMEVRAYGLMLRDVADRCSTSGGSDRAAIVPALRALAVRCADSLPSERPSFGTLLAELDELTAKHG